MYLRSETNDIIALTKDVLAALVEQAKAHKGDILPGSTLCSGIICEELNGTDYVAVPYKADKVNPNSVMEIGYIVRKNIILSQMGEMYVKEIRRYLGIKDD